jgi:hypothetical protein
VSAQPGLDAIDAALNGASSSDDDMAVPHTSIHDYYPQKYYLDQRHHQTRQSHR